MICVDLFGGNTWQFWKLLWFSISFHVATTLHVAFFVVAGNRFGKLHSMSQSGTPISTEELERATSAIRYLSSLPGKRSDLSPSVCMCGWNCALM